MVNWEDGQLVQEAYVEINGTRYPVVMPQYSGNTPMTSENFNKMQTDLENQIKDKNIITARKTDHYYIQNSNTAEEITGFTEYNKIGSKLSVQNGKIVIGSGVSKVKVFYNALMVATNNTTRGFTYLLKNNEIISQESYYFQTTGQQISCSFGPALVDVQEGDTFSLRAYGGKGNGIFGGTSFLWTSITVEGVD